MPQKLNRSRTLSPLLLVVLANRLCAHCVTTPAPDCRPTTLYITLPKIPTYLYNLNCDKYFQISNFESGSLVTTPHRFLDSALSELRGSAFTFCIFLVDCSSPAAIWSVYLLNFLFFWPTLKLFGSLGLRLLSGSEGVEGPVALLL